MYPTLFTLLERTNNSKRPRALFLAGPAGSGKSTVARDVAGGTNAKFVDIDAVAEHLARKQGVDLSDAEGSAAVYTTARDKNLRRRNHYVNQQMTLVIDGTGRSPQGIERVKRELEDAGYETGMLFVAVDLEVALRRNATRSRKLDSKYIEEVWHDVMRLVRHYDGMFTNFFYVKNEDGSQHGASSSSRAKRLARQFVSGLNVGTGTDLPIFAES